MRVDRDSIGRRGEVIVAAALSKPVAGRYRRALFRVTFLGDKYPLVDYVVAALDALGRPRSFFVVQVRATSLMRTEAARLRVRTSKDEFNELAALPVPAFVIGVDVEREVCWIVAADRPRRSALSSMTLAYDLATDQTRVTLYKEVMAFRTQVGRAPTRSSLRDA